MKEWHELIGQVDAFSCLGQKERESLLAQAQAREIKRKQAIVNSHTPATHLIILKRGAAKTVRNETAGQNLLVDFLKPGEVLGEEAVFLGGDYELTALPFDTASVLAIPAENVKRALDTQPRLGRSLAALSYSRVRAYRQRLYNVTAVPAPVRLADSLHMLARNFGRKCRQGTLINLRITHQDLADYIGAARETVTLFLSQFRKDGIIIMDVRKIIIPDLKALKKKTR